MKTWKSRSLQRRAPMLKSAQLPWRGARALAPEPARACVHVHWKRSPGIFRLGPFVWKPPHGELPFEKFRLNISVYLFSLGHSCSIYSLSFSPSTTTRVPHHPRRESILTRGDLAIKTNCLKRNSLSCGPTQQRRKLPPSYGSNATPKALGAPNATRPFASN